jgi:hypothetical protein
VKGLFVLLLLLSAALVGCASNPTGQGGFPEATVAFVYRTTSQEHERLKQQQRGDTTDLGVMDVRRQNRLEERQRGGSNFEGRLHLLDPTTGKSKAAGFALEGAMPLAWDPDHEHLLFRSGARGDTRSILQWTPATSVVRPVLPGHEGIQVDACFGPEGWKAFSIQRGAGRDVHRKVWVLSPQGDVIKVSEGPWDREVACSPGSDFLIYVSGRGNGRPQLFQLSWNSIRGGDLPEGQPLGSGQEPAFSADGKWVAFSRKVSGRWQIWKMTPDGSGKRAVGRGIGDERGPSISPDGGFIAYSQTANDRTVLRVRRMDGSGDRPLLLEGVGERPVW